ncbi:hypothetical protein TK0532 [Thermococcus kodakarensis KOD1]|uniref:Bacterial Ig-like domain-containing protein n=1 Tax=Thermococcus kodakarensis (strain ATCC BAA-918 / JCM 12380 / KOD1) TaxID=69014 RepID=Q5JF35_THEKO|nr:immunoglobulin-like domain-containing protein [Thermococcus kodakarensis]WCN28585.1 hypothetical protein POG15_02730 [Thermococcus kodakarensis]WCN30882.1 hypothetical protein POG21_02730 [Thermococcus kodakarensis]BAD84721.1 hypothetical protein TK0532 [Thermococcus kodakarensis KOD1]
MRGKTGAACTLIILLVWGLTGPHFYVGLDKSGYHPGEEPVLRTCNIGLTPISFGEGYHLYRLENGTLAPVRTGLIFPAVLHWLMPFQSWEQKVSLKYLLENESVGGAPSLRDLPPGRYRIVKEICGWPRGCVNASLEFDLLS